LAHPPVAHAADNKAATGILTKEKTS